MLNNDKKVNIQINSMKRIMNDIYSYEKEYNYIVNKIQEMKENKEDIYSIRKQEEILEETYKMIPNSKKRLKIFLDRLSLLIDKDDIDSESYKNALIIINKVNEIL
jgi:tubulin-specific chaperone A